MSLSIEQFRLADQTVRASRSVTANLAEGCGRYHSQENMEFCRQVRGSLFELLDHLSVCLDEGHIGLEQTDGYRKNILRTTRLLNGYIAYLRDRKEEDA